MTLDLRRLKSGSPQHSFSHMETIIGVSALFYPE